MNREEKALVNTAKIKKAFPANVIIASRPSLRFGAISLALAGSVSPVWAQQSSPAASTAVVEPAAATAAEATQQRAWTISPTIYVSERLSDNILLTDTNRKSDQVTEIAPGLRIDGQTARLKAHFDYQLRGLFYAQGSRGNHTQNSLNTFGTLEALENWLYLDFSGVITQQSISAFGTQSPSTVNVNANSTETSNFRLSPYLKGRLLGYADYELRYSRSTLNSQSSGAFDSDTQEWTGKISGATALASLGWSLEGHRTEVDYTGARKNESDVFRGLMNYRFAPEIRVSASLGSESNNYISGDKQTWNTHGYGFDWSPTERTLLSAFRERRFFGNGHTVSFTHRTPLTSWRISDSRDVSLAPNTMTTVGLGTIYDLMYNLYQSSIPNATQRAAFVTGLLQQNGVSPNTPVLAGFLSSQASVQRQQEISVALQGVRNTVTLIASRSENQRLGSTLGRGAGDFAVTSAIRQHGFSMNWAHHLTPLSSLSVMASQQNSAGDANIQGTKLRTVTLSYSTKFDPKTTASLGFRRALFESSTNPYQENAITGTLTVLF